MNNLSSQLFKIIGIVTLWYRDYDWFKNSIEVEKVKQFTLAELEEFKQEIEKGDADNIDALFELVDLVAFVTTYKLKGTHASIPEYVCDDMSISTIDYMHEKIRELLDNKSTFGLASLIDDGLTLLNFTVADFKLAFSMKMARNFLRVHTPNYDRSTEKKLVLQDYMEYDKLIRVLNLEIF